MTVFQLLIIHHANQTSGYIGYVKHIFSDLIQFKLENVKYLKKQKDPVFIVKVQ